MALTADTLPVRRGRPESGNQFGYPVAPGEVIFRGGLFGVNAAGQAVRPQTTAAPGPAVALCGVSNKRVDNRIGTTPSDELVVAEKGTWGLTVPAATVSSLYAAVYATDDNTLTLTGPTGEATTPLPIGTLAGFEGAQTFVRIKE